ncbi:MAG: hypothetical protein HGB08_04765 [Candidatus Moranbacteria bacterium]|nr:hypothetical protein [Candidatus Moranbacteria bacterium]
MGTFQDAFSWVAAHGYFFIFLVMCIEGPVTTAAAGFAAALGYFNPVAIYALSVLGDLIPDTIYYLFGYLGQRTFVRKIGVRMGFNDSRISNTAALFEKHFGKTMVISKLTPVVSTYGSILAGYLKLSYKKFIFYCAEITFTKSAIFLLLGYYFGRSYRINEYLHNIAIALPIGAAIMVLIYVGYNKLSAMLAKRLENNK